MENIVIIYSVQTCIMFISLIFGFLQIRTLAKQIKQHGEIEKSKATYGHLNHYYTNLKPVYLRLQEETGYLIHKENNVTEMEWISRLMDDDCMRANYFELTSYFEQLAVGIEHGYFNEKLAKENLYAVLTSAYNSLYPYICYRRNETGNTLLVSNFERLARRWRNEK